MVQDGDKDRNSQEGLLDEAVTEELVNEPKTELNSLHAEREIVRSEGVRVFSDPQTEEQLDLFKDKPEEEAWLIPPPGYTSARKNSSLPPPKRPSNLPPFPPVFGSLLDEVTVPSDEQTTQRVSPSIPPPPIPEVIEPVADTQVVSVQNVETSNPNIETSPEDAIDSIEESDVPTETVDVDLGSFPPPAYETTRKDPSPESLLEEEYSVALDTDKEAAKDPTNEFYETSAESVQASKTHEKTFSKVDIPQPLSLDERVRKLETEKANEIVRNQRIIQSLVQVDTKLDTLNTVVHNRYPAIESLAVGHNQNFQEIKSVLNSLKESVPAEVIEPVIRKLTESTEKVEKGQSEILKGVQASSQEKRNDIAEIARGYDEAIKESNRTTEMYNRIVETQGETIHSQEMQIAFQAANMGALLEFGKEVLTEQEKIIKDQAQQIEAQNYNIKYLIGQGYHMFVDLLNGKFNGVEGKTAEMGSKLQALTEVINQIKDRKVGAGPDLKNLVEEFKLSLGDIHDFVELKLSLGDIHEAVDELREYKLMKEELEDKLPKEQEIYKSNPPVKKLEKRGIEDQTSQLTQPENQEVQKASETPTQKVEPPAPQSEQNNTTAKTLPPPLPQKDEEEITEDMAMELKENLKQAARHFLTRGAPLSIFYGLKRLKHASRVGIELGYVLSEEKGAILQGQSKPPYKKSVRSLNEIVAEVESPEPIRSSLPPPPYVSTPSKQKEASTLRKYAIKTLASLVPIYDSAKGLFEKAPRAAKKGLVATLVAGALASGAVYAYKHHQSTKVEPIACIVDGNKVTYTPPKDNDYNVESIVNENGKISFIMDKKEYALKGDIVLNAKGKPVEFEGGEEKGLAKYVNKELNSCKKK